MKSFIPQYFKIVICVGYYHLCGILLLAHPMQDALHLH